MLGICEIGHRRCSEASLFYGDEARNLSDSGLIGAGTRRTAPGSPAQHLVGESAQARSCTRPLAVEVRLKTERLPH
jgi:hypothetical protein